MSENVKLRLDLPSGESQLDKHASSSPATAREDNNPADDAESAMRKALGLLGEPPRHRPEPDRAEVPARTGGTFGGGVHRRRFVQDGDVPVTVLRRDLGHDSLPHRAAAQPSAAPTSNRLQRVEAALAAESAAREKAERQLAETQTLARDLQTKIGHAELAKNEAIESLRKERDAIAQQQAEYDSLRAQIRELQERFEAAERTSEEYLDQLQTERYERRNAEKALKAAEEARSMAEQLIGTLSKGDNIAAEPPRRTARKGTSTVRRVAAEVGPEPEPVKWWLTAKPAAKRR